MGADKTVGIIGLGNAGTSIFAQLHGDPSIGRFLVAQYDDTVSEKFENIPIFDPASRRGAELIAVPYNRLERIAEEADFTFIVVASKPIQRTREGGYVQNEFLIRGIAEAMRNGQGYFCMVTNPCDIFAYYFAAVSEIPYPRVTSLNNTDSRRVRRYLTEISDQFSAADLEKLGPLDDLEIFTWGPHIPEYIVPIFRKEERSRIPFMTNEVIFDPKYTEPVMSKVRHHWETQIQAGVDTSHETGFAAKDIFRSYLDGKSVVSIGALVCYPNTFPVYIGAPCRFGKEGIEVQTDMYPRDEERHTAIRGGFNYMQSFILENKVPRLS